MNAIDVVNSISSEWAFAKNKDTIYLYDLLYAGREDYSYGVTAVLKTEDLTDIEALLKAVPESYIENHFENMSKDLAESFGIDDDTIARLNDAKWEDWEGILRQQYEAILDHPFFYFQPTIYMTKIMRGEEVLEPVSEENMAQFETNYELYKDDIERFESMAHDNSMED